MHIHTTMSEKEMKMHAPRAKGATELSIGYLPHLVNIFLIFVWNYLFNKSKPYVNPETQLH